MAEYPSVTQVLVPYIDTTHFTDECRYRGTAVHAACLADLQGLWYPPLNEEYQGYLVSWKQWADKSIQRVILVETRLYDHKWRVSGRPDLIAELKDGQVFLIDLKTSLAAQKSWPLQIAAYRHLAQTDKGIITVGGMTLRLKPDGSGCLPDNFKDYVRHLNIFLGILNAYHYFF